MTTSPGSTGPPAGSTGRFAARRVLVTGAARGIGLAVASRLATEGADVTLTDRSRAELAAAVETVRCLPGAASVTGAEIDVADAQQVPAAIDALVAQGGPFHVLVNNAGIIRDGWLGKMSDRDWSEVLAVNLSGAFYCARAVLAGMREAGHGRIVSISSRSRLGNPGQANYSASKAGLVGLTRTLALELARFGITVNAVAPGLIDTPLARGLAPEVRQRLIAAQPAGRMGTPAEVAAAVAFLASDEAAFITGQVLNVCGGRSVGTESAA